jgi:hypothetical protein
LQNAPANFDDLSPALSRGAGLLLRVVAVVLAMVTFGVFSMVRESLGRNAAMSQAFAMGVLFAVEVLWLKLYNYGGRLSAPSAADVLAKDKRPPILLLRSFDDDHVEVSSRDKSSRELMWFLGQKPAATFEVVLERLLKTAGPVIAIGRPGESLPPLGAARLWVSNDEWQARVMELLGKCQRVVMIMGEIEGRPGLTWEFQRLLECGSPEKVVFVVPPVSEEVAAERWERYRALSLGKLPPYQGREVVARFDAQGTCQVTRGPEWKRSPEWRDEEGYVHAFEKIGLARSAKRGWGCAMAAGACLVLFIGFLIALALLGPSQPPEALSDSEVERLVRDIATFE